MPATWYRLAPVAEALETEAKSLWRTNRRGRQEIRVLRERIRGTKAARAEAFEADCLLRESMRELERTTETLKAARAEREQKRLLIERITHLLPIREQMDQATRLEVEAGPPGALDGLPADPAAERERLLDEVATLGNRLQQTQADAVEPQERQRAFSADHRAILDARRCIEEIHGAVAAAGPVGARLSTLDQEIRDREHQITLDAPQGLRTNTYLFAEIHRTDTRRARSPRSGSGRISRSGPGPGAIRFLSMMDCTICTVETSRREGISPDGWLLARRPLRRSGRKRLDVIVSGSGP